jgi:hypothetical protein
MMSMNGMIEMMNSHGLLLQQEEPGWGRMLFALIFLLIWVISAIAGAISKRRKQQQVDVEWEPDEEVVIIEPREVPPTRPRPVERRVQRPAPPPLPPRMEPARPVPPARRQPRPAAVPSRVFPGAAEVVMPDRAFPQARARVPISERSTPVVGAPPSVSHEPSAGAPVRVLRQWLKPQNLQTHFVLTEVLQQPLALRPGSQDRI